MESEITPPQFRNIKTHGAEQTLSLPEEIIEEILSRLPVKSLLKFRCVSKSWRSLIGSKRFIKIHLENSTKNTSFTHHRVILQSTSPNDRFKQCSLHSLLNEPFTYSFAFDDPINIPWKSICLVGCCNGLVCILIDRKHFILWNPSTRMSKILPDIDVKMKHGHITKYGFGCDESSGDYKVFGILSVFWITGRYQAMGKVYSLKTNSWKKVKNRHVSPFAEAGKLASGRLHWARIFGLDSRWDIVSFDLKSDMYGIVEQPSYSEGGFHPLLGVLGGCLCVLCDYKKTRSDVWVMKQYGVKESWDKVVTLPYLNDPWTVPFSAQFCIDSNGEVLLFCGPTFIIYSPKDDAFRRPRIFNFDSFREAHIYVESLVSLVPDGEQATQTLVPDGEQATQTLVPDGEQATQTPSNSSMKDTNNILE